MAETERRLSPVDKGPDSLEVPGARFVCRSEDLMEGGEGVRFEVEHQGHRQSAFVIRWRGRARAFFNRCGHVPVELDYQPGQFFDFSGHYLICATHGALYDPATGACQGGRCNGVGLEAVPVMEQSGGIYLLAYSKEAT